MEMAGAFCSTAPPALFCLTSTLPCSQWESWGQGLILALCLQVRGDLSGHCCVSGMYRTAWLSQLVSATNAEKFNKQRMFVLHIWGKPRNNFLPVVNTTILLTMEDNTKVIILNP